MGLDIEFHKNNMSITPLFLAIDENNPQIVKLLLEAGAKLFNSNTNSLLVKNILKHMDIEAETEIYKF